MLVIIIMRADNSTEETEGAVTEEQKRQASSVGQIVLYFYNTASLEEVTRADLPRLEMQQTGVLSRKAVKVMVSPGDSLTYQTRYVMSTVTHHVKNSSLLRTVSLPQKLSIQSRTAASKRPRTHPLRPSRSTTAPPLL